LPIKAKQKGSRGETELLKLLQTVGVSVKKQPSSGAFGTRINAKHLQGDLVMSFGDTTMKVEVKRRKVAPQVLDGWLVGCEVLAIRADHGDWRFYMPEDSFLHLLSLAREAAERGSD
jgi:hypothetical protein